LNICHRDHKSLPLGSALIQLLSDHTFTPCFSEIQIIFQIVTFAIFRQTLDTDFFSSPYVQHVPLSHFRVLQSKFRETRSNSSQKSQINLENILPYTFQNFSSPQALIITVPPNFPLAVVVALECSGI
jgi:hypothetical protein